MFELPELTLDQIARVADWVELCALYEPGGVSQAAVADVFHDSGMLGTEPSDFFLGDLTYIDQDTFSSDDATEWFAELVWQELANRQRTLNSGYPFATENSVATLSVPSWQDVPAFAMLLIADLSRSYGNVDIRIEPESGDARLFEKIVEAATRGLLRGTSVRFGWPIEPGWEKPIDNRIRQLGDALNLRVENLEGKTRPKDKDRGLDVVARLSFGDDGPGTILVLTQCATGQNWRQKHGEPAIADWRDILRWDGLLVRAVAVPWRLDESFNYVRTHRHFDAAIVLDRPRLLAGCPDRYLAETTQQKIRQWCKTQFAKIPTLS
jgi:hypothetical protein